ncbi:unnamed protein product [Amoebophrya sp. A25]|nr:unnamed protein product [Amoebophrya sp. A25]|eukprot:GSA25T00014154001.1
MSLPIDKFVSSPARNKSRMQPSPVARPSTEKTKERHRDEDAANQVAALCSTPKASARRRSNMSNIVAASSPASVVEASPADAVEAPDAPGTPVVVAPEGPREGRKDAIFEVGTPETPKNPKTLLSASLDLSGTGVRQRVRDIEHSIQAEILTARQHVLYLETRQGKTEGARDLYEDFRKEARGHVKAAEKTMLKNLRDFTEDADAQRRKLRAEEGRIDRELDLRKRETRGLKKMLAELEKKLSRMELELEF